MTDTYANYAALAAAEVENTAYARRSVPVTGATWSAIAIHGGGIEPGSGEMARQVGVGLMNHYEFAGLLSSGNSRLHITSTNFDEPTALGIVTAATRCISFHGATGTLGVPETFLGGLDTVTAARVGAALTAAGFTVTVASEELNDDDPANIANKTKISAGVQLEMSNTLRGSFFPGNDLSRANRDSGARTSTFYRYAAAVVSAFDGRGMMAQNSVNVSRWATLQGPSAVDADITATVATDKLATGGSHFCGVAARLADTDNCYIARLEFTTAQVVNLTIRKRVGATETLLSSTVNTGLTHAAGTRFAVRFQVQGSALRARAWLASATEPSGWPVQVTDTSLTAAGKLGLRAILSSTNTNTLPVTASWDGMASSIPQGFTVTRSVNGVVKAQTAGTPIELAHPMVIAL